MGVVLNHGFVCISLINFRCKNPSAPEVLVPLKFLSGFVKVQWSVIPCQVCGSNAALLCHYVGSLERTPL